MLASSGGIFVWGCGAGSEIGKIDENEEIEEKVLTVPGIEVWGVSEFEEFHANEEFEEEHFIEVSS